MVDFPQLVVTLERFSSGVGYGYMTKAMLVEGDREAGLQISCKVLHCVYGEASALQDWQVSIKPATMHALSDFCAEFPGGWFGVSVSRPITLKKYYELRRRFLGF